MLVIELEVIGLEFLTELREANSRCKDLEAEVERLDVGLSRQLLGSFRWFQACSSEISRLKVLVTSKNRRIEQLEAWNRAYVP